MPKRQSCPYDIAIVYNDVNNFGKPTLKNVNSDIEYRVSTSTKWETASEGMFFGLPVTNTNYIFRIKAKEGSFASSERTLIMYASENYLGSSYNNVYEELRSLNKTLEWKVDNGNYTPHTLDASNVNISNIIDSIPTGNKVTIYIRKMTTEKKPNSRDKMILLYSRLPVPTTPQFDNNTKSLIGVNKQMQYRKLGEKNWKNVYNTSVNLSSLIRNTSNTKIEVRMMPNGGNSASKSKVINCY